MELDGLGIIPGLALEPGRWVTGGVWVTGEGGVVGHGWSLDEFGDLSRGSLLILINMQGRVVCVCGVDWCDGVRGGG